MSWQSTLPYYRIINETVQARLGCTEISLLVNAAHAAVPLFDTTRIQATKAHESGRICACRTPVTSLTSLIRHLATWHDRRAPRPSKGIKRCADGKRLRRYYSFLDRKLAGAADGQCRAYFCCMRLR